MSSNWSNLTSGILDAAKATFGTDATYTPTVGDAVEIQGIFDNASEVITASENGGVETVVPRLGVKLADLDGITPGPGDTVEINSVTYLVLECLRDGQGGATLALQRQ